MNITISGHQLQFDWGTLEIMAEQTGADATNPLEGIEKGSDRILYIFHAAHSRAMEEHNAPRPTLSECRSMMRSFSVKDAAEISQAFVKAMKVDAEEDQLPQKKTGE